MAKKREKLLKLLSERFGDDPKGIKAIHEYIADDYEKKLKESDKSHKEEIRSLKEIHANELKQRDEKSEQRHQKMLEAIEDAKGVVISVATSRIEESSKKGEESHKKSIKDLERKFGEKYDKKIDKQSENIERISEFAVGAPNRSIYVGGNIVSSYYSDVNFIAGTGVVLSTSNNETTAQANITITAAGTSLTIISITGTIDDANVNFTALTQPTLLNINGAFYQQTSGAITWTYAGGNITLSSPVGAGGSIFGI